MGRHPAPLGPYAPAILERLLAGHRQSDIAVELHLAYHSVQHYAERLIHAHGAATVALMVAGIHAADKAELRDAVVLLERKVARMAQGERRRGQVDRRIGPE